MESEEQLRALLRVRRPDQPVMQRLVRFARQAEGGRRENLQALQKHWPKVIDSLLMWLPRMPSSWATTLLGEQGVLLRLSLQSGDLPPFYETPFSWLHAPSRRLLEMERFDQLGAFFVGRLGGDAVRRRTLQLPMWEYLLLRFLLATFDTEWELAMLRNKSAPPLNTMQRLRRNVQSVVSTSRASRPRHTYMLVLDAFLSAALPKDGRVTSQSRRLLPKVLAIVDEVWLRLNVSVPRSQQAMESEAFVSPPSLQLRGMQLLLRRVLHTTMSEDARSDAFSVLKRPLYHFLASCLRRWPLDWTARVEAVVRVWQVLLIPTPVKVAAFATRHVVFFAPLLAHFLSLARHFDYSREVHLRLLSHVLGLFHQPQLRAVLDRISDEAVMPHSAPTLMAQLEEVSAPAASLQRLDENVLLKQAATDVATCIVACQAQVTPTPRSEVGSSTSFWSEWFGGKPRTRRVSAVDPVLVRSVLTQLRELFSATPDAVEARRGAGTTGRVQCSQRELLLDDTRDTVRQRLRRGEVLCADEVVPYLGDVWQRPLLDSEVPVLVSLMARLSKWLHAQQLVRSDVGDERLRRLCRVDFLCAVLLVLLLLYLVRLAFF